MSQNHCISCVRTKFVQIFATIQEFYLIILHFIRHNFIKSKTEK